MLSKINNNILFVLAAVSVLFCDQFSKQIILKSYPDIVFKSFGFFGHLGYVWAGFFIGLLVIFFVIFKDVFLKTRLSATAFGAILAGAASNIFDRVIYSTLIDWIPLGSLRLNLADLFIIISGIYLIYFLWKKD